MIRRRTGFWALYYSVQPILGRYASRDASVTLRLFLCTLFAIAFFLQGFIAQTHIHHLDATSVLSSAQAHIGPVHAPLSDDDSVAGCPFCQAVAHASAVFLPTVASAVPGSEAEYSTAWYPALVLYGMLLEYHQQQRGPPSH